MTRRSVTAATVLVVLAVAFLLFYSESLDVPREGATDPGSPATSRPEAGGDRAILDAFSRKRSGIMVESAGTVERVLSDDVQGSRHQRFIIRLDSDHTLLVSHNIDLASRVPLDERDEIEFRGQYEWNERGGVIHWTHHDPDGSHPGGWIRHRGTLYD